MVALLSLVTVGFFLGMRHATDADHVIAVSTIVSRQGNLRGAAWIGVLWGLGHTLTIAIIGGAIILFSVVIPPRVGLAMEFAVGVMLVILGLFNLSGIGQRIRSAVAPFQSNGSAHFHVHAHGDFAHAHVHGHEQDSHGHNDQETPQAWLDQRFGGLGVYSAARPLIVGIIHGMAGSAAIALMALTAIRDPWWGVAYLLLFGLGTIAGMVLITAAIAAPFAYSLGRFPRFNNHLRVTSGLLSVAFGLGLMFYIGYVDGLFGSHPHWNPS